MQHGHRYTIADDEAVQVLIDKMLGGGTRQRRREKLLKALEEASQRYQNTSHKERGKHSSTGCSLATRWP